MLGLQENLGHCWGGQLVFRRSLTMSLEIRSMNRASELNPKSRWASFRPWTIAEIVIRNDSTSRTTRLTGKIIISPAGIDSPLDPFFAKADTASNAMEEAVSKPMVIGLLFPSYGKGLTKAKQEAHRIHLERCKRKSHHEQTTDTPSMACPQNW